MNMKRILALLLALVMVFALTACGNKDADGKSSKKDDADVKAAEKGEAPSYEALIAAVEKVYNDSDATVGDAMKAAYGAEFGAVMMQFIEAMQDMDDVNEEDLSDVNVLDLDGYEKGAAVKFEIAEANKMDEEALKAAKDQASAVSESMEMVSTFASMYDNMSEEELAEADMTADDVAQMKEYIAKLTEIGSFFAGAEITEGYQLKLNVTIGEDTQVVEKSALLLNGNWVFADLIELMA